MSFDFGSRRSPSGVVYGMRYSMRQSYPFFICLIAALAVGSAIVNGKWIHFAGIGVICLLLLWPVEVALGTYSLLLPFDPISVLGSETSGTTLTWVAGGVAGMALLGTGIIHGRLQFPPRAAFWWSFFVLWGAATTAWAIEPQLAFGRISTAFTLLLLYLVSVSLRVSERELRTVSLLAITGGCAAALYACFISPSGLAYGSGVRSSIGWADRQADPNQFAASLLLPLSLALAEFLSVRKLASRTIMLLAVAVMGYAVLLTMSRGAFIALVVLILAYVYRMPKELRWRFAVPVSILGLALMVMPSLFFTRLQEAGRTGGAGRMYIWQAGAHALMEHGIIGAGLDNFSVAYQQVSGDAPQFRGYLRAAHNIYLGTWVELGLPGIALLTAAIAGQIRGVGRALQATGGRFATRIVAYEAACWAMLAAGFFLDVVWTKSFWLSWILLALAVKLRHTA